MPLTPDQERELDAVAAELTSTDPALARALTGAPGPGRRSALTPVLGLFVLVVATVPGLVPLAVGLATDIRWLMGVGAVTTCFLPFLTVWAIARLFPRLTARLRALG